MIREFQLEIWLALKYIFNKKQEIFISFSSIFAILSVLLGIAILVLVISVMDGFNLELKKRLIGVGSHIQVTKFGDEKAFPVIKKELVKNTDIIEIAPFIRKQVIFSFGSENNLITMEAIDPNLEKSVTNLAEYLVSGNLNLKNQEIIIGQEFAKNSNLKKGEFITFFNPVTKSFVTFKIAGIFYSGSYLYDSNLVYINLNFAQKIFNLPNTVSGFKIKTVNNEKVDLIKQNLLTFLDARYEVNTWLDLNRGLISAMEIERKIMFIILSLFFVLAGFNIATALMMNVMEKKKEIGILKSLGFTNLIIKKIFIFQGLILTSIGICGGLILGIILTLNVNLIMDIMEKVFNFKILYNEAYYINSIPIQFNYFSIVMIIIFCFLIALLSAYYPALKASKLEPIEVLKNE